MSGRVVRSIKGPRKKAMSAAQRSLRLAIAHDNGGTWFLAESKLSVSDLETRFRRQQVGSILFKRIGGLLAGTMRPYIFVQILLVKDVINGEDAESREPIWKRVKSYEADEQWPHWDVEQCLKDLGVEILSVASVNDVMQSRRF